jgi:predicted Zn-dependent peptidase
VEHCIRLVRKELNRLVQQPLTQTRFQAALRQIRGQIGVACDNFENYALDMAKSYLHYNRIEGVEDTYRQLEKLTPELLQQVAADLFTDDKLSVLIYQ